MKQLQELLKGLMPHGHGEAAPGGDLPIPKEWIELFRRRYEGAHGLPPHGAQPKARPRLKRPGEEKIIEEEVEVETPKK
jgi:hypothetical protein